MEADRFAEGRVAAEFAAEIVERDRSTSVVVPKQVGRVKGEICSGMARNPAAWRYQRRKRTA